MVETWITREVGTWITREVGTWITREVGTWIQRKLRLDTKGKRYKKVRAGISCSVASSEIFLGLCPAGFGAAVWCSAADSHHKRLDRVVRSAGFLAGGVLECNLSHR